MNEPVALHSTHADPIDESELDLSIYWRAILKRKKQILFLTATLALLSVVIVLLMTPIYRATATIMVEENQAKLVSIEEVFSQVASSKEYFQTQATIIKSRTVADRVIRDLHLESDPLFDPRQQPKSWEQKLLQALGFSQSKPWTTQTIDDAIAKKLMDNMSINTVSLTRLIKVSYDSPNSIEAAKIANAIAHAYIQDNLDARFKMAKEAAGWLHQQLSGLKASLNKSEQALQDYRDKEHIVNTQGLAQMGTVQQIADLTQSLVTAKAAVATALSNYQQVATANPEALATLPIVQQNATIDGLVQQEAKAKAKVAELSKVYGPKHPKMLAAQSELAQTKSNLRKQIHLVALSLKQQYQADERREQAIANTLSGLKNTMYSLNRKEFRLQALQRDVDSNQDLYDSFMKRLKETLAAQDNQSSVVARVVDRARTPIDPAEPRKALVVGITIFMGLFLGSLIALLLEHLDNTIKSPDDAEARLGKPVLASLPELDDHTSAVVGRFFMDQPQSVFSEAISSARTGILLSAIDEDHKVLVVTSSLPSEGKTTTAINLALALAHNKKVLLLDADMRRPSVIKTLGLDTDQPGLSDLVRGATPRIQTIEGSPIHVLGAGEPSPNPVDLILSQKFSNAMALLKKTYDLIVIDSPPVQLTPDATVLSTHATGTIFVIKADETPYPVASHSIKKLARADANVIGVVLNQLDFKQADRYYGAYTTYGVNRYGGYYVKAT